MVFRGEKEYVEKTSWNKRLGWVRKVRKSRWEHQHDQRFGVLEPILSGQCGRGEGQNVGGH